MEGGAWRVEGGMIVGQVIAANENKIKNPQGFLP